MQNSVHIVLSDEGWILEKLAAHLGSRLPYVTYGLKPDRSAAIQYYMTYGSRSERLSPIEMALFTHRENTESAARRFDETAAAVDVPIAMSRATGEILSGLGIGNVEVVSPGVDSSIFRPKLKIAVVGRTYHTGRKGEDLVNAVSNIPDIEWHFTGDGWPDPALHVPEAGLADFYRSMDYVLVSATIEGGPMCVLEALACGKEVIGPDVGWVTDFPHISYKKGDAESLRSVLAALLDARRARAAAVSDQTWERWASNHHRIFQESLARAPGAIKSPHLRAGLDGLKAALVLHGAAEAKALGGPTIRVPRTASALRRNGIDAEVVYQPSRRIAGHDLVHVFNIWPPGSAVDVTREARRLDKPLVFSPILLNLSNIRLWSDDIPACFKVADHQEIDARLAQVRATGVRLEHGPLFEPSPGYAGALREIAENAQAIIFLSEFERALFSQYGGSTDKGTIVRNPVDVTSMKSADPALFRDRFDVADYVLCVGRIEQRKNQLLLAHALRGTSIPLVLVGHTTEEKYAKLVRAVPDVRIVFAGRLDPGSPMLLSAFAGARVFALPSFAEGAPLAALEAAAVGARMVLSATSGEREYFGDRAIYCNPYDPADIRSKVLESWNGNWTKDEAEDLRCFVEAEFSWDRYAAGTTAVYERVIGARPTKVYQNLPSRTVLTQSFDEIVVDVTTSLSYGRLRSGIVRVEYELSRALMEQNDVRIRFVAWGKGATFYEVPDYVVRANAVRNFLDRVGASPEREGQFKPGTPFVVLGSGWMQNSAYATGISQFGRSHGLILTVLIHDLTPTLFPFWYAKGYASRFTDNLQMVVTSADKLLVYSESTRRDVEEFAATREIAGLSIEKMVLGSNIRPETTSAATRPRFTAGRYTLATGAIHTRKNYGLLHDVWIGLREKLKGGCPHLVIVGGIGWNGEDCARAMTDDPRTAGYIHILSDVGDEELDRLYQNCLLTLYPSLYEGWGLPVSESLSYGKICLASNVSSIPEIAPDCTDLLDPTDRKTWLARLLHYATSSSARAAREARIKATYHAPSWGDSAESVLRSLARPRPQWDRDLYTIGAVLGLSQSSRRAISYLAGGWHVPEQWGVWAKTARPTLRFCLSTRPREDLLLNAIARVFIGSAPHKLCAVVVNGIRVADWTFRDGAEQLRTAIIPRGLIGEDSRIEISFEIDRPTAVKEIDHKSADERSLGVGLSVVQLEEIGRPRASLLVERGNDVRVLPVGRWIHAAEAASRKLGAGAVVDPTLGLVQSEGPLILSIGHPKRSSGPSMRPAEALRLRCILRSSSPPGGLARHVAVFTSGAELASWQLPAGEPILCEVVIPAAAYVTDPLDLLLLAEDAGLASKEDAASPLFGLLAVEIVPLSGGALDRRPARLPVQPLNSLGRERPERRWLETLDSGWYPPEANGVWSIGRLGSLRVASLPTTDKADPILYVRILGPVSSDALGVEMLMDGAVAGRLELPSGRGPNLREASGVFELPTAAGTAERVLALRPERSFTPAREWGTTDKRILGILLRDVSLHEIAPWPLGETCDLAAAAGRDLAIVSGWCPTESADGLTWTWSNGGEAIVWLRRPAGDNLQLIASVGAGFTTIHGAKTIQVAIEGGAESEATFTKLEAAEIHLPLAGSAAGMVAVRFRQAKPLRPIDVGAGADGRLLGLQLFSIGCVEGI